MPRQYHKNPRQITKKQDADLESSLLRLGDISGIVHNLETDEVIGGNQRGRLFDFFGGNCETVLTEQYDTPDEQGTVALGYAIWQGKKYSYRQVRWDEKTAEEANIRANKAGGTWDFDILGNEWEIDELLEWGFEPFELGLDDTEAEEPAEDPGAQIDRAEELREKWDVHPGQLWQLGEHRLICGDCTDADVVARVMGGEKADAVITDPPYNVDKAIWDTDVLPMLKKAANVVETILEDDGICFWFCATRYVPETINATSALSYKWMFIWYPSNNMAHGDLGFQKFTAALVLSKGAKIWRENMQDLREFPIRITSKEPGHPTPKPIELICYLVEMASRQIVFDGFLGSGTTLIACEQLDRRCRAVEISPAYVAVAIQRWVDMTGQTPELLTD
jgi:hypothetical protein